MFSYEARVVAATQRSLCDPDPLGATGIESDATEATAEGVRDVPRLATVRAPVHVTGRVALAASDVHPFRCGRIESDATGRRRDEHPRQVDPVASAVIRAGEAVPLRARVERPVESGSMPTETISVARPRPRVDRIQLRPRSVDRKTPLEPR